jgi:hypothetical protein
MRARPSGRGDWSGLGGDAQEASWQGRGARREAMDGRPRLHAWCDCPDDMAQACCDHGRSRVGPVAVLLMITVLCVYVYAVVVIASGVREVLRHGERRPDAPGRTVAAGASDDAAGSCDHARSREGLQPRIGGSDSARGSDGPHASVGAARRRVGGHATDPLDGSRSAGGVACEAKGGAGQ